ncbi:MAG: hypothetical protein IPK16_05270 [Anaerolineales bacterium]|nr:hypothetical protein [Anaerolineales bacterium]
MGISWLSLAYALWLMLFRLPATVLLFSLWEAEAANSSGGCMGCTTGCLWMQAERVMLANEEPAVDLVDDPFPY